jgi:hypothetical protein
MGCQALNASGSPCASPDHLVGPDGLCRTHREGGAERMAEIGRLGGAATRVRLTGEAFKAEELRPLRTIEDAKAALDLIRVAVMTRRLTHAEGNAASRAVAEWIKGETAAITARLVNELRGELEAKAAEMAQLRQQLMGRRAT